MKTIRYVRLAMFILLVHVALGKTGADFRRYFTDKTMRVDFYFTGNSDTTIISLDEIVQEPFYAGSFTNLLDTMNLGEHFFEICDSSGNTQLYSRGFSSIYHEWQTTEEALSGVVRTFSASVRFPYPKEKIKLTIFSRDEKNLFSPVYSCLIDPDSRFVKRDLPRYGLKAMPFLKNGDPHRKVDILVIPEGYRKRELRRFKKDLEKMLNSMFSTRPFSKHKKDFNIWYLKLASDDSGIDDPRKGFYSRSFLNCSFNSLDTDRYILCLDNKRIRDVAANAPYDQIYILINTEKYGGGGIFNLFSTCYARDPVPGHEWWPQYVFVHEFGHAFAGLGDEYYSSNVSYSDFYKPGVEPWEPNVTALLDTAHLKWRKLVKPGTPIPTPWNKEYFDTVPRGESAKRDSLLKSEPFYGMVGAFEGAGYSSEGLYRPALNCRMFSKSLVDFDPVCADAIERMIRFYTE